MPQLPFLMENREHLELIIKAAKYYDAQFVYPAFGVTLRDGQRVYYYKKLEAIDKSLVPKYKQRYKNYYSASCVNSKKMYAYFKSRCKEEKIYIGMPIYEKEVSASQLSIFQESSDSH